VQPVQTGLESGSGQGVSGRSREEEITPTPPGIKYLGKVKGKVHPCTGTKALYRPYGP
jgi:hypothetical protein